MEKVLITGGNGYIGRRLKDYLETKYEVFMIDRFPKVNEEQKYFCIDLLDRNELEKIIFKVQPDIIIHLAGIKKREIDYEIFRESMNINFFGALNLFDVIMKYKRIKKIIVLGSAEEYGRTECVITEETPTKPINAYSFSKECLFNLCNYYFREFEIPILYLRPTVIYGPNQDEAMFISQLVNTLKQDKTFKMTKGEQWRDFIYIDDLIEIISILTDTYKTEHWVYNICSNKQYQIREIAEKIADILNKRNLLDIGALSYRSGEVMKYNISGQRVFKEFGWLPKTNLYDGLNKIINIESK